jgi:hypothetical protein
MSVRELHGKISYNKADIKTHEIHFGRISDHILLFVTLQSL